MKEEACREVLAEVAALKKENKSLKRENSSLKEENKSLKDEETAAINLDIKKTEDITERMIYAAECMKRLRENPDLPEPRAKHSKSEPPVASKRLCDVDYAPYAGGDGKRLMIEEVE